MATSPVFAITCATGRLSAHVIDQLLAKGVPPANVIAVVRSLDKAAPLAARGITVRAADYAHPATLATAFAGATAMLLVPTTDIGNCVPQHQSAIDAAKAAGVTLIAFVSLLHADTTPLAFAGEYKDTEAALAASGVPHALLRNGWYWENWTEASLGGVLAHGAMAGCWAGGRIAFASRADLAAAAVAVLMGDKHLTQVRQVYELGGPRITAAEYAAEVSRQSGKTIPYADVPAEVYLQIFLGVGLPAITAGHLVDASVQGAQGALDDASGDLERLIGRPPTTLAAAVAAGLAALAKT